MSGTLQLNILYTAATTTSGQKTNHENPKVFPERVTIKNGFFKQ